MTQWFLFTLALAAALAAALWSAQQQRRRAVLYRVAGERLLQALAFYARPSSYDAPFPIARDRGAWARRVLRGQG